MPPSDYRPAEAIAAAVPLWVSARAFWSRIRHRKSKDTLDAHRLIGLK